MNTVQAQQLAEKLREVDFLASHSETIDAEFELLVDFAETAPSDEQYVERLKAITEVWPNFNY